jgi:hypothetical protein
MIVRRDGEKAELVLARFLRRLLEDVVLPGALAGRKGPPSEHVVRLERVRWDDGIRASATRERESRGAETGRRRSVPLESPMQGPAHEQTQASCEVRVT